MRIATLEGPLAVGRDHQRLVPASKQDQVSPSFFDPRRPSNLGDWFVTQIVDRLLEYEAVVSVPRAATDKEWAHVNAECDALVLKGGNYIQPKWLSSHVGLDVIKKIKIPIIMFGAGVQSPPGEDVRFEEDEVAILRHIHESSACSAVRGNATAEALQSIGIDNAVVTGDPTIFWSRQPQIDVRRPTDESAGFSFRQGLFSGDPELYKAQFRAIETVRDRFSSVRVLLQGEEVLFQYYLQAVRWGAEFRRTTTPVPNLKLKVTTRERMDIPGLRQEIHDRFDRYTRPAFLDWFMNNTFFSWDISEYIAEYLSKGLVVGCRLHSNLLSLAHGTPTFFLTYDRRTEEVVDLLRIPGCPLGEFSEEVDLLDQDWTPFETQYRHYFEEMRSFLESNGLKHRLGEVSFDQMEPKRRR